MGRPKGSKNKKNTKKEKLDEVKVTEKRGPGRPKKNKVSSSTSSSSSKKNQTKKRKPGRPKKEKKVVETEILENQDSSFNSAKDNSSYEVSFESTSIEFETHNSPKTVKKGKMDIDAKQMLNDLSSLERLENNNEVDDYPPIHKESMDNVLKRKNNSFKFAIVFLSFAIIILLFALYMLSSKATIYLDPEPKEITSEFETGLNYVNLEEITENVAAVRVSASVSLEDSYQPEEKIAKTGIAEGKVRLFNTSNIPQKLVATTRLIAEGTGDLYRIEEFVEVPANGEVVVAVSADKAGMKGEADQTKFNIPGLYESRQKDVYAVAEGKITSEVKIYSLVSSDDITKAREIMELKLKSAVRDEIQKTFEEYLEKNSLSKLDLENWKIIDDTLNFRLDSRNLYATAGEEVVDGFFMDGAMSASAIFVNEDKILNLVISNMEDEDLIEGQLKVNVSRDNFYYDYKKQDAFSKKVYLNIGISGEVEYDVLDIINSEDFVSMSSSDVKQFIEEKGIDAKVRIKITPIFRDILPSSPGNIEIKTQ
ncbi:hypothetical protein K9M42_02325 [Patescibacteria group bacterium]|nr:hypothetical protein [Patescibacteria group bacterium]